MKPSLLPGFEILYDPHAYRKRQPQIGDIVILYHPDKTGLKLVKRITEQLDHTKVIVRGDNPQESTDSRDFGPISIETICGKVTCLY